MDIAGLGTIAAELTGEAETVRDTVNAWIRTSGEFDAVADFARAVADPDAPDRIRPAFDSGDHLHPNPAGYRAMADAVDLHPCEAAQRRAPRDSPCWGARLSLSVRVRLADAASRKGRRRKIFERHAAVGISPQAYRRTSQAAVSPRSGREVW
ncbi:hypothetical protein [Nonomuraea helvata]|uniref:SGNH hydrolase-type esterase domain-containing protein n=1 Tax=Nonomuraea helvata TaxID=37484 RepID=A0ABV5RW22_9ACTN